MAQIEMGQDERFPCEIFFFFDGDGKAMSKVRRGVLSLRVVRQMLS